MEQDVFLPFSSLISSMLLFKRQITCMEIVNLISMLGQENIFIDDEVNDKMDFLFVCVECFDYNYFRIKNNMTYDTLLFKNSTVREFLYNNADVNILNFIEKYNIYGEVVSVLLENKMFKKKVKRKLITRVFNLL